MKFLQDNTFGQDIKGASIIHTLDPRAKLLSISILLPLIFTARGLFPFFYLVFTACVAVTLSGISISYILKGLRHFLWLVLFAAIFH
ncbi:MAG: cobalt ABC transporter ATP-binding protein, partial [Deltaproteobacteria bacterium]|nr:cobalt ABC transporter ATP-binding protein [Deltaproteobacteria bacterium]